MTDLNAAILALQIDQGAKFISVQFHRECGEFDRDGPIDRRLNNDGWSEKTYTYKVEPAIFEGLKTGSLVVVRVRGHLQVARVAELDVDIDFGDASLIRLLRWVVADVSANMERVTSLETAEVKAKKQITNARLRKESKELLLAANLDEDAVRLLDLKPAEEAQA